MSGPTILYGQKGHPVGSIEGDALFDKAGVQIGYLSEGHFYTIGTGERIGCFAGGVVYNDRGAPQAFAESCRKELLPMEPRLTVPSPRLSSMGHDVSRLPPKRVPEFLRQDGLINSRDRFLDGLFE